MWVLAAAGAHADDYWAYSYKYLDVVAVGTDGYAVNVAHNVDRLDRALRRILPLMAAKPVPTHIYVLADADARRLGVGEDAARFSSSGTETTVVSSVSRAPYQYWGAYFGYTGGVLDSNEARYPLWFRIGAPTVFAATEFRRDQIMTGEIQHGLGYELLHEGSLMPMSTFLALRSRDLPGLSDVQRRIFQAESWYVAREFLVEGHYRSELTQYLTAMAQGSSEPDAFAASFRMSHEQLDKFLAQVMYDQAHIYILSEPDDRASSGDRPRRLTGAEVKERLDGLAARFAP
jgi:hypothetical protein